MSVTESAEEGGVKGVREGWVSGRGVGGVERVTGMSKSGGLTRVIKRGRDQAPLGFGESEGHLVSCTAVRRQGGGEGGGPKRVRPLDVR